MADPFPDPRRAAERAARLAYGRLLAWLCMRTGDVAAAEDALAEAFAQALATWPDRGVPDAPDAWLLQVARRKLTDAARRAETRARLAPDVALVLEETAMVQSPDAIADERLSLLFTCAHPAIDPAVRTPLMLQTILGLDAARIASVFLVSPTAMAQRLVRAKTKIKRAGIPFAIPDRDELGDRTDAVLNAIYGAYTAGWEDGRGRSNNLTSEAEWLSRMCCEMLPESAEAHGLVSLILHCEARRPARQGSYTPLREQDTELWDERLIYEAEAHLRVASAEGQLGRFQLEAAIQSVHAERRITGETRWDALNQIYNALLQISPSLGAAVARAAVILEVEGPERALDALADLPPDHVQSYAPYWATRAHILAKTSRTDDAHEAYRTAIGLTPHMAVRTYLEAQREQLGT